MTNYTTPILDALRARLPDCPDDLLHAYALLVLAKGVRTTAEDVHNAWSLSTMPDRPDHRSLVPFADLPADVAAYDELPRRVIREVAARRPTSASAPPDANALRSWLAVEYYKAQRAAREAAGARYGHHHRGGKSLRNAAGALEHCSAVARMCALGEALERLDNASG
jgi:hypothetical protein